MGFGFKQPLVGEKRGVTTLITAAKETIYNAKRIDFYRAFISIFYLSIR